ncbi:hypothetical protein [Agromyces sp. M3QZ16-3]|uniref:hypothetical protein n=1 Tax=Agromyces sp. M3QZ16-3 TaxID=3447585 RepID=UPI003F68D5D5
MAHPFASIDLGFSAMGERMLWWGGCAWDSFAVPDLLAVRTSRRSAGRGAFRGLGDDEASARPTAGRGRARPALPRGARIGVP